MSIMPKGHSKVLSREVAGEVTLLDQRTGAAYLLEPVAAAVWTRCNGHQTVDEVAGALHLTPQRVRGVVAELGELGVLGVPAQPGPTRRRLLGGGALVGGGIVAATVLAPAANAAASTPSSPVARTALFTGADTNPTYLFSVSLATAAQTVLAQLTIGVTELAVDPYTGQLYIEGTSGRLYRYDPVKKSVGASFVSLGSNAALGVGPTGTLYAILVSSSRLVTVNPATNVVVPVGSTGIRFDGGDLAVDLAGDIYVVNGANASLYKIPAGTSQATLVGPLNRGTVDGIAYLNGLLYSVSKSTKELFTIDPVTAATTTIGSTTSAFTSAG